MAMANSDARTVRRQSADDTTISMRLQRWVLCHSMACQQDFTFDYFERPKSHVKMLG
jgi:hypothetical protein